MIELKQEVKQQGIFRIKTRAKNGEIKDWGEHKNRILNHGINRLLTTNGSVLQVISVGASSAAPEDNQTKLVSLIASTDRQRAFEHGYNSNEGYGWTKMRVAFAAGAVVGLVAELGVGWDTNDLWSRALVLDVDNSPTSIPVTAEDELIIEYELRSWWITPAPKNFNYELDGVQKTVSVAFNPPAYTHNYKGASALYYRAPTPFRSTTTAGNNNVSYWSGVSGNTLNFIVQVGFNQYTDGLTVIRAETSQANTGRFPPYNDDVVITFTPPIEKGNEHRVILTGSITISRS